MLPPEAAIPFVKEQLDHVMRTGSYSIGFAVDIAMSIQQRRYNPHAIIQEIAGLEGSGHGRSRTKQAKPLIGKQLRGYWHKHHSQPRFLGLNLLNEMQRDGTVERILMPFAGQDVTPEVLKRLTHALINENFLRRANESRLTGEWIVFSKRERKNYYITLANHLEGDDVILERIRRYEDIDRQTNWKIANKLQLQDD